jgi:putative ABC transport system permease protein
MMRLLEALNRLRDRLRRDKLAAELDEELQFHQAMLERDSRAGGASPETARTTARRQLGNATYVREETRAVWSLGWIDDALQDLRYAARVLRHNVPFSLAVIATLALGIGANTAIFSVVNAVVLQPLPYAQPDRLYSVWTVPAGNQSARLPASYPDLMDWQTSATSFSGIGGYAFNRYELSGPEGIDLARSIAGSSTLYSVLDARPLIGRLPRPDEDGVAVVTISHRLWLRRYAGNPAVIGRKLLLDEQPYTIIGVMPQGFHFPLPEVELWTSLYPIRGAGGSSGSNPWITNRGLRGYRVLARLKPGVTAAAAESQMNSIMDRLGRQYPEEDGATDIRLQSVRDDTVGGVRRALWLTFGAAGLVLLLACANVAHLMLARASARAREIAVRRALGAHRGRVVRQLLTESVLLGVIGGVSGLAVAAIGVRVLVRISPADFPRLENVALDPLTIAFAAVVSIGTGILFGLAPTFVASAGGVQSALREQGRGATSGRVRAMLTSAEVAFALVVLVAAGLVVRSLVSLLSTDMGFHPARVVTMHVVFPSTRYPDAATRAPTLDRVLAQLRAIPGVISAGASTSLPPARMQQSNGFEIEGEPTPPPNQEPTAIFVPATPSFLTSIGVPLLRGRDFNEHDAASAPKVALISESLARRNFPRRDPLGRRLRVADSLYTIVGVVGDVGYEGIGKPAGPVLYVPFAQSTFPGVWIAVRGSVTTSSLIEPIRNAIHVVDPLMNARELRPMEEVLSDTMVRPRFQAWLLATFGGLALILAAVGIYGVIAYAVSQRTSEIGLRLALGAPSGSVVSLVLRRGLFPVAAGIVIGLATAMAFSRVMTGLVYGVSPTDTITLAGVTALLGAVAVSAAYLPARRAARLDPIRALRSN